MQIALSWRNIRLSLEAGGTASISFGEPLPNDFVQLFGPATSLFMATDQFTDTYRILHSVAASTDLLDDPAV